MNIPYTLIFCAMIFIGFAQTVQAQGCVAIRHFSTCSGNDLASNTLRKGDWQVGMNYRYFQSFRHFRGTHEEPDRVANNSEVINDAHGWDFNISYGISRRGYASLTLPFVINVRSSLYEHGRTERHTTFSRGLADVRIGGGFWVFDPENDRKGNIALGAGIKIPTGNYHATDIFYNVGPMGSPQVRPVDQSIQPGDGGFGLTLDFQLYQELLPRLYLYAGGFYLLNPREMNGVHTFRDSLSALLANEAIMSVPDQYSLRAGFSYAFPLQSLGFSLGARYEGVPVEDLIGGSEGFRRPGSVLSVEPGINYLHKAVSFNLSVPFAVRRARPQSVTDLATQQATGNPRHGDAAFADYLINFGVTIRINKGAAHAMPSVPLLDGVGK